MILLSIAKLLINTTKIQLFITLFYLTYPDPYIIKFLKLLKDYQEETLASDTEISKIIGAGKGNLSNYLSGKKKWPKSKTIQKYYRKLKKVLEGAREKKKVEIFNGSETISDKFEDPSQVYEVRLIEQDQKIEEQGKEIGKLETRITDLEEEVKAIRAQLAARH